MSWIDKELRRRQMREARPKGGDENLSVSPETAEAGTDSARIAALWARFEQANAALPAELQLRREGPEQQTYKPERAMFQTLLLAANDAGIGYTGGAIRYFWPRKNMQRSNNFWIRYQADKGAMLSRRQTPSLLRMSMAERRFDERKVEHILRCMVTLQKVNWRSVGKRRFWLF
jgi:hypothetical protein